MTLKTIGATALLLTAIATQAQGVVSPVTPPQTVAASVPPPVPDEPVTPPRGFNPFRPPTPAAEPTVDPNTPPPVDPVVAAIAEELQEIREKGERVGTVDGKIIFRYGGRYLVEALTPDASVTEGPAIDSEKRKAALAGECVIRVVTDSTKGGSVAAAEPAPTKTR